MPTRFNVKNKPKFGVYGVSTGFDGVSISKDLTIPPVGIEDADAALFRLFDKEIPFQVSTSDKNRQEMTKVPVIFAAAEKWALNKRYRALRDRNGSLILPLITVVRTTIQQTPGEDITGRGINQQTGEIVIKRNLSKNDRSYQNLANKFAIKNQKNLAVKPQEASEEQVSTDREIGLLSEDPTINDGALLLPDRTNNIYETYSIPSPQFYTAIYEVTFWTQYTVQMFQLVETLISSFLPQGNAWKLDTPKGYWFVARVDGNTYNSENNADDMSQEERIIKYKFNITLPGYIIASKVPGGPVPVKKYVSNPTLSFDITTVDDEISNPLLGADDPTLPANLGQTHRRDQRDAGKTKLFPSRAEEIISEEDPALKNVGRGQKIPKFKKIVSIDKNGNQEIKYTRIVSENKFVGETVVSSGVDIENLTDIISDD